MINTPAISAIEQLSVTSLSLGLSSIFGSDVVKSSWGKLITPIVWVGILYITAGLSILINLGFISMCYH